MLDRRRKLMDAWAKFCTMTEQRKGGDVVPMRGRHA
jgi:hypothetical protein